MRRKRPWRRSPASWGRRSSSRYRLIQYVRLLQPRIIPRGSVDRRHLATHRSNVGAELPAMMNGVKKEIPEEPAKGRFHEKVLTHVELRWTRPLLVFERLHTIVERLVVGVERLHGLRWARRWNDRPMDFAAIDDGRARRHLIRERPDQVQR